MGTIRGRSHPQVEGDGVMTLMHGFGMLAVGLIAIAIGGLIIYKIINHKPKEQKYGK